MKKLALMALALGTGCLATGRDVVVSLLVPTEAVAPGRPVSVNLVLLNPAGTEARVELPGTLEGHLAVGDRSWPVTLRAAAGAVAVIAPGAFANPAYTLDVPADVRGQVVLEISRPGVARAVLDVTAALPAPAAAPVPAAAAGAGPDGGAGSPVGAAGVQRTFAGHFSTHLAIYFLFGADKPAAKFQFSFKYRIFGDSAASDQPTPSLRGLYFGYTQRSLWDITSESSPFYDTSYMPEVMFESLTRDRQADGPAGFHWLGFQASLQHESNGNAEPNSRSLNLLYVRPMLAIGQRDGWWLVFAPKLFAYVGGLSDNPDLKRYRGYGEYSLMLTKSGSLQVALTGRIGDHWDRGSLQVDATYPLRAKFGDFATFVMVQYFDGYGESLLDYQKKSAALRAGVSLVR